MNPPQLPVRNDLKILYYCSVAVLALAAIASAAGVLRWDQLYPESIDRRGFHY